MSKRGKKLERRLMLSLQYAAVLLTYVISIVTMINSSGTSSMLWVILLSIALIGGACVSILPFHGNNWKLLGIALFLEVCIAVIVIDAYSGVNGFLFDGMDTLLYTLIVPFLTLVCIGLFVASSMIKLGHKSRT